MNYESRLTRQALLFESTMHSSNGLCILGTSLTILTILADIASAEGALEPSETEPKGTLIICTIVNHYSLLSSPNKIEPQLLSRLRKT